MLYRIFILCLITISWFIYLGKLPSDFPVYAVISVSLTFLVLDILKYTKSFKSNKVFSYKFIKYIAYLLKDIVHSSIKLSRIIWSFEMKISPTFGWIKLAHPSQIARVIIADSITLTPSTLSIELEGDRLFIHSIDIENAIELKRNFMERKIYSLLDPNS